MNVEDEVAFALEEHKTVIPVLYRDCKVPFQLRPFQNLDFRTDYPRGLKTLLKTLGVEQSPSPKREPITVFYSYSHKDEDLRNELDAHLAALRRSGLIREWHDRKILAGQEWGREISRYLDSAQLILFLLSADFVSSGYCVDIEVKRALERQRAGEAVVVPVILRPVVWGIIPQFNHLQALPKDGRPVTEWPSHDLAFVSICEGILALVTGGRPTTRRTLPESRARRRFLDAALPARVPVAKPSTLLVMIRRTDSPGLRGIVEAEPNYQLSENEVNTKPLTLNFPVDENGTSQPLDVLVKIESPEFEPKSQAKTVKIPPRGDSELRVFLLTPIRLGPLLVNLEVSLGDHIIAGCLLRTNGEAPEQKEGPNPHNVVSAPLSLSASEDEELIIVPPERLVVVGVDHAVLRLTVRNGGDAPLRVTGVSLREPQGIQAHLDREVDVAGGTQEEVCVHLNLDKVKAGEHMIARGRLEVGNHRVAQFVWKLSVRHPGRLIPKEPVISTELYRILRRQRRSVELTNIGDDPVQIGVIESTNPAWAQPLCRNSLVAPNSSTLLDVILDGTGLKHGRHEADIVVNSSSPGSPCRIHVVVTVREMQNLAEVIGIDFGTSLSCVARVRNGNPELMDINIEDTSDTIEGHSLPSVVFFEENMFPIVGVEARERARLYPAAAVHSVKRLLGSRNKLRIRESYFEPYEVASEIFRALLATVEQALVIGGEYRSPERAVLTVPADVADTQIADVLRSAVAAGLTVDHATIQDYVIDEPTAAALYYLWKSRRETTDKTDELIFVYDLGAGTLDCSLVRAQREGEHITIEVLATTGDRHLGGDDIDLDIARSIADSLAAEVHDFDPFPVKASLTELAAVKDRVTYSHNLAVRNKFCRLAEELKIQLSTGDEKQASKAFPVRPGEEHDCALSRGALQHLLEPYLRRSDFVVEGCCKLAGVSPDQVDTVLHAGRGSSIISVRDLVNKKLSRAHDRSDFIEAKTCVALGAAWWAYIKNVPGDEIILRGLEPRLPHSVGYRGQERFQTIFKKVFPAGTTYPSQALVTIDWNPRMEFQLEILEQRFGSAKDFRSRGFIRLPAAAAPQRYECLFKLTKDRTIEVELGGQRLQFDSREADDFTEEQE